MLSETKLMAQTRKRRGKRDRTSEELADLARLRAAWKMHSRGRTQRELAEHYGVSGGAVSQYFTGETAINWSFLRSVSEFLGIDPKEISPRIAKENMIPLLVVAAPSDEPVALVEPQQTATYHEEEPLDDGEFAVPALNVRVGAGNRIHTEQIKEERQYRYSREWARRYGLNPKKLIRYRVRGTSMEPLIKDESWILVEMGYNKICDGNLYLLRYGDQVSVKFLFKRYDNGLIVRSFNPSEPDVVVPPSDLEHVEVLGRVVETSSMWVKRIK